MVHLPYFCALLGGVFSGMHVLALLGCAYVKGRRRWRQASFSSNKVVWIGPIKPWRQGIPNLQENPALRSKQIEAQEKRMREFICSRINEVEKAKHDKLGMRTQKRAPTPLNEQDDIVSLHLWSPDQAESALAHKARRCAWPHAAGAEMF
jgi:hypothetical protein